MGRARTRLRAGLALAAALAAASAAAAPVASAATEDRAYEMVSPVAKNGYDVLTADTTVLSSSDGGRVVYKAGGGFDGAATSLAATHYVGSRSVNWATTPLDPPQLPYAGMQTRATFAVSSDLTKALVGSTAALAPGAIAGGANLYLHDVATGSHTLVAALPGTVFGTELFSAGTLPVDAVTPELDHVVFSSAAGLVPGAAAGWPNVYEWSDGQLRLVNHLPDGSVDPLAGRAGSGDRFQRAPRLLSPDGGRVFFTSPSFGGGIYLRQDGVTVPVSISRRAGDDPSIARSALFKAATADGGAVFFVSSERLTDDATTAGSGELYRYDIASRTVVDLTVATDPADAAGGQVVDVPWVAADGSSAYLVARANLAPGGVSGELNLYRWSADGPMRLVGRLDPSEWDGIRHWVAVSPNERFFAFRTAARLTAYDNSAPSAACPDLFGSPGPCAQVYRYDAVTGELTCASCDPDGAPPRGPAILGGQGAVSVLGGAFSRAVLDDGRVFFDTRTPLVAHDTNDLADVYVFGGGGPQLISTGRGAAPATFADVTPSGNSVFFFTRGRLVGQDVDDLADLYVARVGGGLPAQDPPAPPPPCRGTDCRPPAPSPDPPSPPPPSTVDFTGAGNVSEPPTPRALPLRLGRRLVAGTRVTFDVTAPARGRVAVRGTRIATANRPVPRAGTYRLRVRLTSRAARTLARGGRLAATVRVTFTPRLGTPESTRFTVRFRRQAVAR